MTHAVNPVSLWRAALAPVLACFLCACGSRVEPSAAERRLLGQIHELKCDELKRWRATGAEFRLLDVREDDEWRKGHASQAEHLSRWKLVDEIGARVPDKAARIVLYCGTGKRSAMAAVALQKAGYRNVFSLTGGLQAYTAAGLPVAR